MHGPVLLINLGTAGTRWQAVGVGPEGSDLAARLPATTFVEVAPAHHFTFLPECKPDAPAILAIEGEEAICDDPPGTGRAAVHRRIVEAVAALLAL